MKVVRSTPIGAGFVRSPDHDRFVKHAVRMYGSVNWGWEVWRTPEGVLVTLPPGCCEVGVITLQGPRGETAFVVEPPGVHSLWPMRARDRGEGGNR